VEQGFLWNIKERYFRNVGIGHRRSDVKMFYSHILRPCFSVEFFFVRFSRSVSFPALARPHRHQLNPGRVHVQMLPWYKGLGTVAKDGRKIRNKREATGKRRMLITCWLILITCWLILITCWLILITCWLILITCWLILITCWLTHLHYLLTDSPWLLADWLTLITCWLTHLDYLLTDSPW